ncbi:MAG: metallophosphoesterase [Christensenellaceae bacterium]
MKVFAIGDLHLSGRNPKPMNIFGENWTGHFERIRADWLKKVGENDLVLLVGDMSWAMNLDDGLYDLARLADLPGKKIFIRGNHDYWWTGITKIRTRRPSEDYYFLQNDCLRFENLLLVGSRGWTCPGSSDYTAQDEKLYLREAERFRLCFAEAAKERQEGDTVLALMHYPPFGFRREDTNFTRLFEQEGVHSVIFGHLHGSLFFPLYSEKNGVRYYLTSCDKRAFTLTEIPLN